MRSTILLLLSLSACATPSANPELFVERRLATIPREADPAWTVAFSSDGGQAAFVAKTPEGFWVVRGDWSSRRFEAICCLAISEDGNHVAFLGGDGDGEVVSLDDHRLVIAEPGWRPVWPLTFSADGAVVAYALAHEKERQARMVVAGRKHPVFEYVGQPSLSKDGSVVAYRAERNGEWLIRIGDKEEPFFDGITDPVVSGDGSTVAYAAEDYGRWTLHHGDHTTSLSSMPHKIFISPDGRHVGWIDVESLPEGGSKMRAVVNGKPGEPFGIVGTPAISPTGPLAVYGAEEGGRKFVVLGTRKIETPDRISDPVFSPDGRKVGYGARIGRELWWKVLDVASNR